jgi:N-dimethylarginine dimethylaminohydrolase
MGSKNEYSPLKKVVIGIADQAERPEPNKALHTVSFSHVRDISNMEWGTFPQQVIEEANEDLNQLCETLIGLGIEVVRPRNLRVQYYNYCPRDTVVINNDIALPAPMALTCRRGEYLNFAQHLKIVANVKSTHDDSIYNRRSILNPSVLALNETHPVFDAANIIRNNDDWLYLVSNTGNKKGAEYLQQLVGDQIKIHLLENVYSYAHIDSTIAFLRDGLLLANPSRIKNRNMLPEPFRKWDIIWAPDPVDVGHWPNICMSSKWINVNLLSINENLVILEEHQEETRKKLAEHGIESIMLPMRHSRTLGGSFHCVSLDLERET